MMAALPSVSYIIVLTYEINLRMILKYVSSALEVQNLTIECGCRCGKTLGLSKSVDFRDQLTRTK
jgi:hypothetical protein